MIKQKKGKESCGDKVLIENTTTLVSIPYPSATEKRSRHWATRGAIIRPPHPSRARNAMNEREPARRQAGRAWWKTTGSAPSMPLDRQAIFSSATSTSRGSHARTHLPDVRWGPPAATMTTVCLGVRAVPGPCAAGTTAVLDRSLAWRGAPGRVCGELSFRVFRTAASTVDADKVATPCRANNVLMAGVGRGGNVRAG